jgi:hypothetical protein
MCFIMAPKLRYEAYARITDEGEKELAHLNPVTKQLLFARGVKTKEEAEKFLNPNYDTDLHDPFLFTDMEKAVERVLRAMREHEHIVIYTDYDCDGIPGGVILHDFFVALGYEHFENYIPHRHHEGYGFNAGLRSIVASPTTKQRRRLWMRVLTSLSPIITNRVTRSHLRMQL